MAKQTMFIMVVLISKVQVPQMISMIIVNVCCNHAIMYSLWQFKPTINLNTFKSTLHIHNENCIEVDMLVT